MKKLYVSFVLAAVFALFITGVSAKEEFFYSEGLVGFPETNYDKSVSLFADDTYAEFEKVLTKAWDNLEEKIDISPFKMTITEYKSRSSRYNKILENNPIYTYYNTGATQANSYDGVYIAYIFPQYRVSTKSEADELKNNIINASEEILLNMSSTMSDFDKIMAVHDYMVLNYCYDETLVNHNISIMETKTGVCQAYAYAFKYMMDVLGIESTYVTSDSMQHMWNLVKLDGKWYHIDPTWDDPISDKYGQVRHLYALKSTDAFMYTTYPANPHTGFSTGNYTANSAKYDNPEWSDSYGSIVHCKGKTYWWEGDDLVTSDGVTVVENIVKNGKWYFDQRYYSDQIYAGLATHNGKLYYNSDKSIYCYDPTTGKTTTIYTDVGICGMFINKNTLYYTKSKIDVSAGYVYFNSGGEIALDDISAGSTLRIGDKVTARICNTSDKSVIALIFDGEKTNAKICGKGVSKIEMTTSSPADVFVWDSNLRPIATKSTIK